MGRNTGKIRRGGNVTPENRKVTAPRMPSAHCSSLQGIPQTQTLPLYADSLPWDWMKEGRSS